jgi:hypothetical protein
MEAAWAYCFRGCCLQLYLCLCCCGRDSGSVRGGGVVVVVVVVVVVEGVGYDGDRIGICVFGNGRFLQGTLDEACR